MRVAVCGHYAQGKSIADGQTVKTQTVVKALSDTYGSVVICDTYRWKRSPLKLLLNCFNTALSSTDVVVLTASGGSKIFIPIFYFLGKILGTRIHYSVIGSVLPELLKRHKWYISCVKAAKSIQVETAIMKRELNDMGLNNVYIVPNFKDVKSLRASDKYIVRPPLAPYSLCTFSRVIAEKGIEDAINVVSRINEHYGSVVYTLDIYGPVGAGYKEHFKKVMTGSPEYIRYKGTIESSGAVDVLKTYYLLLFPTHYKVEGLPGTIIDAYAAGLPVVSSRWNSFSDIIIEGVTGYGVDTGDNESLFKILCELLDTSKVLPLKEKCLSAFEPFSYESGRKLLAACLEGR